MSRIFVDDGLLSWEVFASAGPFGLPERPKIVFHCLSEPNRRAQFVVHEGDQADAEQAVVDLTDDGLRELLGRSRPLS
jgi:hypothetical protein